MELEKINIEKRFQAQKHNAKNVRCNEKYVIINLAIEITLL